VPLVQAAIVPSSVTKINREPPKLAVGLDTTPIRAEGPSGGGIVTTSAWGKLAPLYKGGDVGFVISHPDRAVVELVRPQGLTKFGSVNLATPGRSEIRLLTVYCALASEGAKTAQRPSIADNARRLLHLTGAKLFCAFCIDGPPLRARPHARNKIDNRRNPHPRSIVLVATAQP
jgi:hypothetical protein